MSRPSRADNRKVIAVYCGAHRWDGREETITHAQLATPLYLPREVPVKLTDLSGPQPPPSADIPKDEFVWDGSQDSSSRYRFVYRKPDPT